MPHIDRKDFHWFMGVKFVLTVLLFSNFVWWKAILLYVVFFMTYQHIVALLLNLTVMDIMDFNTFVTNDKAPTNIMTVSPVSKGRPELSKEAFLKLAKQHLKARSCIVEVLGDKYYKELVAEEIVNTQIIILPDGHLKNREDVEKFLSENLSKPMPLDRPQWQVWVQRKYGDDVKGVVIWKAHHSLADGISSMGFNLQLDQTYDVTKLMPFREIKFLERWMVRLMVPIYLPIIIWESYLRRRDRNPLHDGKRKLTGVKRVALSKGFEFQQVKQSARALNVTINEFMLSALSIATSDLFRERGDDKTKRMRIAVPASIRWKQYMTYDEVKMENKFAPIPLKIELESDPDLALQKSKRVSRAMKSSFAKLYTVYFLSLLTPRFLPTFLLKLMGEKMTKPFTMAFSNTPGVLKSIRYKDVDTLGMATSFICAGRLAMAVAILSYASRLEFSVVCDTCIQEDPQELRDRLEKAITMLMKKAQDQIDQNAKKEIKDESQRATASSLNGALDDSKKDK